MEPRLSWRFRSCGRKGEDRSAMTFQICGIPSIIKIYAGYGFRRSIAGSIDQIGGYEWSPADLNLSLYYGVGYG
jgi:hypothetical protein